LDTEQKIFAVDFPEFTFGVVSPELPCGAAWLANCLLELNISAWHPWDIEVDNEWKRLGPFHYQYAAQELPWQQTLPALKYLREFQFKPGYVAHFCHRWPIEIETKRPLIFFVRDPRDALFSHWRRTIHNEPMINLSFEDFVRSRYHQHPFSFRDYLLIFLQLWKKYLSQSDHLIVRFEDYRQDARKTLKRVLSFLGIEAAIDKISRAIACSDFSAIRRVEDRMERNGSLKRRFNYSGTAFEYQNTYTSVMHDCLGADFDEVCKWLGYATWAEASGQSSTSSIKKAGKSASEFY
jgi:hypothetical protein